MEINGIQVLNSLQSWSEALAYWDWLLGVLKSTAGNLYESEGANVF